MLVGIGIDSLVYVGANINANIKATFKWVDHYYISITQQGGGINNYIEEVNNKSVVACGDEITIRVCVEGDCKIDSLYISSYKEITDEINVNLLNLKDDCYE
jgi:hypothetical protein